MSSSFVPLDGGCACGQVRYRIRAAPILSHVCHCTTCQRATGSAFSIIAAVRSADMERLPALDAPFMPPNQADAAASSTTPAAPLQGHGDIVEPVLFTIPTESGAGTGIYRCPSCAVALWAVPSFLGFQDPPAAVMLLAPTLDRPWEVRPMAHIFARSARELAALPPAGGDIHVLEGQYPLDRPELAGLGELGERLKTFLGVIAAAKAGVAVGA